MKIGEYIKSSLDEADRGNLEQALMHACAAIDGTSKALYGDGQVGRRFRHFIAEHIDLIQHMFGGIDLAKTVFPFSNNKGNQGVKFEDIVYNEYRNRLMHGEDLPDGWGVNASIAMHHHIFDVDIENESMSLPQSAIYALGFPCVLSPVNAEEKVGNKDAFYKDMHYTFFIDYWWGKLDVAREVIYFDRDVKIHMDFSNHTTTAQQNSQADR